MNRNCYLIMSEPLSFTSVSRLLTPDTTRRWALTPGNYILYVRTRYKQNQKRQTQTNHQTRPTKKRKKETKRKKRKTKEKKKNKRKNILPPHFTIIPQVSRRLVRSQGHPRINLTFSCFFWAITPLKCNDLRVRLVNFGLGTICPVVVTYVL